MMNSSIRSHIEQELNHKIVSAESVSGGSINRAAKIELEGRGTCFLKWNTSVDPDMFQKEARGLQLLAAADTQLVVPKVMLADRTESGTGFLLMEFLATRGASPEASQSFGRELSRLHRHRADEFGLDHDNYIGKLHQSNARHREWTDFFIEERIRPQLKRASDAGYFSTQDRQCFQTLFAALPEILPEEPPGLLHGDLWSGNYCYTSEGKTAVFDPAVYYGSREIELAFTRLFGGFSAGFYAAYNESFPLESGFEERIELYNLYPLLVHTNLFGSSYASQVKSIIRKFR